MVKEKNFKTGIHEWCTGSKQGKPARGQLHQMHWIAIILSSGKQHRAFRLDALHHHHHPEQ